MPQNHRMSPQIVQPPRGGGNGATFAQQSHAAELQALQLQQLQQQQQYAHNRLESLYDSRLDDRNFVPDGMVPGLRPAPRPRSREPSGALYNEHLDDPLQFGVQQRIPQQARNLEQMYPAGPVYNQHPGQQALGRNVGIQLQQAQFRGGPSPIQGSIPNSVNRLPPGLANLGGRPPHDPSQFMNSPIGPGGLHGGLGPNAPAPQGFNNFGGGGNLGFGGNPQGRGPIPGPHHQAQMALNQMAGLGPNANVDLRGGPSQAQFLAMGGGGIGWQYAGSELQPAAAWSGRADAERPSGRTPPTAAATTATAALASASRSADASASSSASAGHPQQRARSAGFDSALDGQQPQGLTAFLSTPSIVTPLNRIVPSILISPPSFEIQCAYNLPPPHPGVLPQRRTHAPIASTMIF